MYPRLERNPIIHPLSFAYRPMQVGSTTAGTNNFDDSLSSALFAATVYHLSPIIGNKTFIPQAEHTCAAPSNSRVHYFLTPHATTRDWENA
jgi:hypothetical protein